MSTLIRRHKGFSIFWDAFCISTILGIWPRYIEPNLLKVTSLKVETSIKDNLKILQISDLHFNPAVSQNFLNKILKKTAKEAPDVIVLTGDFLCNGILTDSSVILKFLKSLKAPLGVFAILGNHDYDSALGINSKGQYDATHPTAEPALRGLKRLLIPQKVIGETTESAKKVKPHPELLKILNAASVLLLDNRTVQIGNKINLTGLGELMAGAVNPDVAFKGFDAALPGVVLVHNPDASAKLTSYPGELILSGHTHGGQINLPWLWGRFTAMENPKFKSGLYLLPGKSLYISRGLGGAVPFRFNTVPEIVSITLCRRKP